MRWTIFQQAPTSVAIRGLFSDFPWRNRGRQAAGHHLAGQLRQGSPGSIHEPPQPGISSNWLRRAFPIPAVQRSRWRRPHQGIHDYDRLRSLPDAWEGRVVNCAALCARPSGSVSDSVHSPPDPQNPAATPTTGARSRWLAEFGRSDSRLRQSGPGI